MAPAVPGNVENMSEGWDCHEQAHRNKLMHATHGNPGTLEQEAGANRDMPEQAEPVASGAAGALTEAAPLQ
eukprot:8772001-Alexandrium_andersonii.AAC.1